MSETREEAISRIKLKYLERFKGDNRVIGDGPGEVSIEQLAVMVGLVIRDLADEAYDVGHKAGRKQGHGEGYEDGYDNAVSYLAKASRAAGHPNS